MDKNNLNRYDFVETQMFIPKTYGVVVSPDDNIISVTGDGSLLGIVKLDIDKNTISLVGKNGKNFSSVTLPFVNGIADAYYDEESMSLVIKVIISDGSEKEILVPFNDLLDDYAKKVDVDKNTEAIGSITNNVSELNKNINDEINNRTLNDETFKKSLEELKNSSVKWTDIHTEDLPNRKSLVLENHDTILGKDTKGNTSNLVMLSKWDVADFGSKTTHLNLNGKEERPTYNDDKQLALVNDITNESKKIDEKLNLKVDKVEGSSLMTNEEKTKLQDLENIKVDTKERHLVLDSNNNLSFKYQFKKITPYLYQFLDKDGGQIPNIDNIDFTDDFESVLSMVRQKAWQVHLDKANAEISALNAIIKTLSDKVDKLLKTNIEVQETSGNALNLKDETKDYIIKGQLSETSNIESKSVVIDNVSISNNARLNIKSNDVEFKDVQINGKFPKKQGNSVINIKNAENVIFKNMIFNSDDVYNGIEIGLSKDGVLPKNILFENCKFIGKLSNNAILVFGTQDNATITLSNCTFQQVSNVLRLSNKSNAKGIVVNINNCKVDQWEVREPWQGFLICEDYTSQSESEAETNNLFSDSKITVNFVNLYHKGEKILPKNVEEVCGTKNDKQVVIVCIDAIKNSDYCLNYIKNRFPTVKFS